MTQADSSEAEAPRPRRALWPRLLLAALLAAVVAAFYLFGLNRYISWEYLTSHRDHFLHEADDHLWSVLLLFFVCYTALTALSVPAAWVLSLIGGALFDR